MSLARARRQVLLIDAGQPSNRQTPHSHNFITHDGTPPADIADAARRQVLAYPTVSIIRDFAAEAKRLDSGFAVTTRSGQRYEARKLLLATGVVDALPAIDGLTDCWGISALHCPYCHGYEVAGQHIGIFANGDLAVELVRLLQQWSKQLIVFTNGPATFLPEHKILVERLNITVVETDVQRVVHQRGYVQHLLLADGSVRVVDALFIRPTVAHRNPLADQLGCESNEMKLIQVNEFGQTNVPGLYAAGDNSMPLRAVSMAVASGTKVGAFLNRELTNDELE